MATSPRTGAASQARANGRADLGLPDNTVTSSPHYAASGRINRTRPGVPRSPLISDLTLIRKSPFADTIREVAPLMTAPHFTKHSPAGDLTLKDTRNYAAGEASCLWLTLLTLTPDGWVRDSKSKALLAMRVAGSFQPPSPQTEPAPCSVSWGLPGHTAQVIQVNFVPSTSDRNSVTVEWTLSLDPVLHKPAVATVGRLTQLDQVIDSIRRFTGVAPETNPAPVRVFTKAVHPQNPDELCDDLMRMEARLVELRALAVAYKPISTDTLSWHITRIARDTLSVLNT